MSTTGSHFRRLLVFALACLATPSNSHAVDDVANIPGYTAVFKGDLEDIRKRKVIRALVTYSPTDFFFYKGGTKGIQVEFLNEYAKLINKGIKREEDRVHVAFIPVTFDQLIPALLEGRGDIAADFMTITPQREKQANFVKGGEWGINELVVSHKSAGPLRSIEDLSGKRVYVQKGSSYTEHLRQLNRKFAKKRLKPVRVIEADPYLLTEDILEMVNAGTVPLTVVDDYIARLWKKVLPNIRVHNDLVVSSGNSVGWAVRKENPELLKSLNAFAAGVKKGTLIGNVLFKRYYGNTRWIRNATSEREMAKLGKLSSVFRKYGDKYGFDTWALVGQAYQESRLDNKKKSHRGAVGIMQVLPSTARDKNVNIKDIAKLENNIHAGTKYLAYLRDHYFSDPDITPENRLAFVWAAYNAGPAKVRKMRSKADRMGLDSNVWFGNVEVAASKLVGRETVRYVAQVYKYYVAYKLADEVNKDKSATSDRLASAVDGLPTDRWHRTRQPNGGSNQVLRYGSPPVRVAPVL